jgi:hypothetical protein
MTNKIAWKFLRDVDGEIKSNSGDFTWAIGQWYTEDNISLCYKGFHASPKIHQAFSYVQGEYLAKVEVKGELVEGNNKTAHSSMRLIKVYKWQKEDSVALAVFAARQVLANFESVYPEDTRPRKAIEAYILDPSADNKYAAWFAAEFAAWSAWFAAESAARSARSAWSAAESARSAVESAARSAWSAAESAARSAESAARSEGRDDFNKIIEKWFKARLTSLEAV